MTTVPLSFVLAFAIALALTPLVRRLALALGAVDRGGESSRKVNRADVPRLGGLAIVAAFCAPLVGLLLVESDVGALFTENMLQVGGLLGGGLMIAALGAWDDARGLGAPGKFAVEFAVAAALYAIGFRIDRIATPFGYVIDLGVFGAPITLLWVVGVVNAVNLIDGLDGLASGVAFFAAATTLVIAYLHDNVLMMLFMATLAGAVLGFLVHNFSPASIFMGDTGSLFLGFVLATTSLQTNEKATATVALLAPVLALGLPIMDTLLSMARRLGRGQSMFRADRDHIHHRLITLAGTPRAAVLTLYGLSLFLGAAAVAISVTRGRISALVLAVVITVVAVFMRRLGYLEIFPSRLRSTARSARRRRNLALRRAGRDCGGELRESASVDEIWTAVHAVAGAMTLRRLALTVEGVGTGGRVERRSYLWETPEGDGGPVSVRREVTGGGARALQEFGFASTIATLDRDDEIAIEALVEPMGRALERLARGTAAASDTEGERGVGASDAGAAGD